jgi:hypothetical protein
VADLGERGEVHNRLALLTPERELSERVEIAASDDRESWKVLVEDAPIYRFTERGLDENLELAYPDSRARWLRLRIGRADRPFPLEGCRASRRVGEPPELVVRAAGQLERTASRDGESAWETDLGFDHVPLSFVRFSTGRQRFDRTARVEIREGDVLRREAAAGEIFRHAPGGDEGERRVREQLGLGFGEVLARSVRVSVADRNDPPIEDLAAELSGVPRYVVFREAPGERYQLLYGHSRAAAPEYEMARLVPREALAAAPLRRLGEPEENAGWISPEPWTERHPIVLWLALALAVGVLALLAVRSLRV